MKIVKSRVGWDEMFMRHVYLVAMKSKDPRTNIGAVLVKDKNIISEGYNGFARGVRDYEFRYADKPTKYLYIVHSEHNSILNAVRHGVNTTGAILYTQGWPCNECAKAIIQSGIIEVVVHKEWPAMNQKWKESIKTTKKMFKEAGIKVRVFSGWLGMVGRNDGKTFAI